MVTKLRIAPGSAALAGESVGSGDPVAFLHAGVCGSRMWGAQPDGVGASCKAIAYDRRGCGRTRAEAESFSAVADLMSVLSATADAASAILVGCS